MSTQSTDVVSSSVAGDSSSFNNAGVSVTSSLERKMELLEERFTRPTRNTAASPETFLSIHSSANSSQSGSRHSFAFDPPTASRSSSVGIDSNLSTASNLPSSSVRSRRRLSRSSSLRAVSLAAEKQMRKVRSSTSVSSPLFAGRAASPHLPLMVQEQERSQSMSNLPSPCISNASGFSNQTLQTSHRAKRNAQTAQPQVVAESPPPARFSPKPGSASKGHASATQDNATSTTRSVLGSQKPDKRKSVPTKRPVTSVTDKQSSLLGNRTPPALADYGRKRARLQFATAEAAAPRITSPRPNQNSMDSHSRDQSNSAKMKPKAPKNNTLINDFFSTAVKRQKAEQVGAPVVAKPVAAPRPRILSSLEDTSSKDLFVGVSTRSSSSTSKELERLRNKLELLQQSYKDKDEQLKAVANNQTIMHTAIKSALSQREKELEEVKAASERKAAVTARAVETLVRAETATEAREIREKLALNSARLGRIVYTRAGMHAVESWEDGYASKHLRKRRTELKAKRAALEKRRDAAMLAADSVRANKENHDSNDTDHGKVGGILVNDELDAMEALESVRLHLATIKKEEEDLTEEERALHTEKGIHIRSLKRVASEDASRFKSRPKLHGRYVLVKLLGKGGFSEVWQAYDVTELREVAVKIHQLDPRWSETKKENYTKHVSREYEIHRDVRHPRIVSLYDVFEIDNNAFATVLELCKGTDLDALLKEKKKLPERDARAILLQILCGMRYLSLPSQDGSRQGIIHYDLKPGNILFDEYGDAKITDFGLSKIVENDPADSMELTSQGAGTYWYLPPECFVTSQSVRISNKVDVFSIGVIYYQMLFGKRPFGDGQSQDKVLSNHTMLNAREVKFPSGIQVSVECKEFIQQCLTYDQAFRPTIGQLCESPYLMKKHL